MSLSVEPVIAENKDVLKIIVLNENYERVLFSYIHQEDIGIVDLYLSIGVQTYVLLIEDIDLLMETIKVENDRYNGIIIITIEKNIPNYPVINVEVKNTWGISDEG